MKNCVASDKVSVKTSAGTTKLCVKICTGIQKASAKTCFAAGAITTKLHWKDCGGVHN